ncbi:hypothetical protein KKB55_09140 [Myxococcota bacterium]|nr:hypothetical protein [Myxococcota bacterium]MBU1897899.1 hypothetical protein [Myxococcota bacterium]
MSLADFLNDLDSQEDEDADDWLAVKRRLSSPRPVFWYGGSGFDFHPLIGLRTQGFPYQMTKACGFEFLYLMSDYGHHHRQNIKQLYDHLENLYPTHLPWLSEIVPPGADLSVEEIILLRHRNLRPTMVYGSVRRSEDKDREEYPLMEFAYLEVCISWGMFNICHPVLFAFVENLDLWEMVITRYGIPVTAFCSIRVAGKSGSWVDVHDPKAKFMQSIAHSAHPGKPQFWVTDRTYALKPIWDPQYLSMDQGRHQSWRRVWPKARDGYGLPQTFGTDWEAVKRLGESQGPEHAKG